MRKILCEKSVDVLIEKADDCAELARVERANADKQQAGVDLQHESAHKLEMLCKALGEEAAELKAELRLEEENCPCVDEQPGGGTARARPTPQ